MRSIDKFSIGHDTTLRRLNTSLPTIETTKNGLSDHAEHWILQTAMTFTAIINTAIQIIRELKND